MIELCLFVALLTLLIIYIKNYDHGAKAPPGPKPWPILGNLLDLAAASDKNNFLKTFAKLGEKYGEIFSIKFGLKDAVILTSKRAIQTLLVNEKLMGRDRTGMMFDRSHGRNLGLAMSDGVVWEKSRSWALRNLREFGFAKSSHMENYIQDACNALFEDLDKKGQVTNGVHSMDLFFSSSIMKIIWQMLFGPVQPEHMEDINVLSRKGSDVTKSTVFGAGLINAYPVLRFLFPKSTGYAMQMDFFRTSDEVMKKRFYEEITKQQNEDSLEPPKYLADAFVRNLDPNSVVFLLENFQILFQDMFLGSTDTTNSFMEGVVLYLALYPEEQEKVYEEISKISPNGEPLRYEDQKLMPYTQAFLLEVHRNVSVLPNYIPRKAMEDVEYNGYVIKKGTVVMVDLYCHNHDSTIWGDAENFKPERFMLDGKVSEKMKAEIINFSVGKRNCVGEQYAHVTSFLMTTLLVQHYKIGVAPGYPKPTRDLQPGLSVKPRPFHALFQKRT